MDELSQKLRAQPASLQNLELQGQQRQPKEWKRRTPMKNGNENRRAQHQAHSDYFREKSQTKLTAKPRARENQLLRATEKPSLQTNRNVPSVVAQNN